MSWPKLLKSDKQVFEPAIESVWTNGIALQSYLLTDGLEAPARPGEVDRPIRETNVPMPERTLSPGEGSLRRP